MSSMRVLVPAVTLAAFVLATDARALVTCRTKGGEVIVRDVCRAKETPLALADFGLPGPQGAAGAAGAAGRAAVYLIDGLGVEVGPVVYANPFPGFHLSGTQIFAVVRKDELGGGALLAVGTSGEAVGDVFYSTADCTGTGVIDGKTFLPVAQVIGDTVFRPVAPPGMVTLASTETSDPSGGCTSLTPRGGCCKPLSPGPRAGLSAVATTSLSGLGFTPPFHVQGP